MRHNKSLDWMAGLLAGTAIGLGHGAIAQATPTAAADAAAAAAASEGVKTDPTWVEPSRAETGARQAPKPCDCDSPYREYKEADTPPAAALFAALDTSDETAFLVALAQVDRPGDYALDGVPLLHALLMPPRALRAPEVYWSMTAEDTARIRTAHQAILPARTRMLAALLATKPALDDVTYSSRRPPLHLALLYGTPAIMDLLLAAGAKPDQRGDENRTPLEFLLNRDFEFAVRMTYLPRLVDRASMTQMVLALFKAGAAKPYAGVEPDVADYLAWGHMVEMTEGAEPLRALAATGTKPAYEDGLTALALAGYLGNSGAVPVLMALGPRHIPATGYGQTGERDVWLDAAQAAVEGGYPEIATQLLRAGMPFAQSGPQTGSRDLIFGRLEMAARPIMNLAAQRGDTQTLQRLLALGAPVGGDPQEQYGNTPLADAVQARQPAAVTMLLAAGADPTAKRQGYDAKSAVDVAVQAGDVATLRQFADAGFDLKTLGAGAIRQALENREGALALMLIEAGVPVDSDTSGPGKTDDAGDAGGRAEPPLLLAVTSGQAAVVEALLSRGADPAGLASDGESALYWLIGRQDTAMLDRLLRAGAKLDDPRLPRAPAPYALLNAAVASGDMALVKRVSQATGQAVADACLPEGGEFNLLDKPGYFAQLQAAGFTGKPNACARDAAPLLQRIVSQLLHSRQLIVARHATVVQLLRQLKASGADLDAPQADGATPLSVAIQLGRQDLADALLSAGASPDSVDAAGRTPAGVARETGQPAMRLLLERHGARVDDVAAPAVANKRGGAKASSKSAAGLPGHYWLRGMREVGSEILLSEDGRFDYMMTYGAVDIVARGTWRSDGRQVFLDTPPIVPFSAIAGVRADTRPAESNQLTVRVYYRDRPVKVDVAMSSADADYGGGPRQSEGSDGVSAPIAPRALKALAVFVPLPSGARWHEVDVSKIDAGARAIRVDVAVPESATGTPLHKTFTLRKDGALVESSSGRELRYEKE